MLMTSSSFHLEALSWLVYVCVCVCVCVCVYMNTCTHTLSLRVLICLSVSLVRTGYWFDLALQSPLGWITDKLLRKHCG